MWRTFAIVAVLMLSPVAAAEGYLSWGSSWHAYTMRKLGLYASEADAARAGPLSIHTNPPIATLQANEPLAVLWDWYGKDYWACYVRNQSGARGWVLCTSLSKASGT